MIQEPHHNVPGVLPEALGRRRVENVEENRVQIVFPGKPDYETRRLLKSNGFRWSRYNMAWQRHLNNAGRWAAERMTEQIS